MKVKLTRPAIRDLAEIGRYTRETWGDTQARRYHAALAARLRWLAGNKALWHQRPELADGVYTYSEQSHVIVFWEYAGGIEILRVLHGRMDLKQRLGAPDPST
jgi:toxin ParE1/3/4